MHRFEVWAPSAAKMAVEVDGARNAMQGPDEQGWWHTNVAKAGPGSDYGFVVDDDDRAYPDPRSLWQPNGVHGLSRVYDHAAFAGKHGWGYDGVDLFAVYEGYGGPDALKRFMDAAHTAGIAVLLDVVYNHFGPVGNYSGKFGPYVTDRHHTPWGGAVHLVE